MYVLLYRIQAETHYGNLIVIIKYHSENAASCDKGPKIGSWVPSVFFQSLNQRNFIFLSSMWTNLVVRRKRKERYIWGWVIAYLLVWKEEMGRKNLFLTLSLSLSLFLTSVLFSLCRERDVIFLNPNTRFTLQFLILLFLFLLQFTLVFLLIAWFSSFLYFTLEGVSFSLIPRITATLFCTPNEGE